MGFCVSYVFFHAVHIRVCMRDGALKDHTNATQHGSLGTGNVMVWVECRFGLLMN